MMKKASYCQLSKGERGGRENKEMGRAARQGIGTD